jgi:transposase
MKPTPSPSSTVPPVSQRRTYSKEYKLEAVKLADDIGGQKAATDLGIDRSLICAWRKALRTEGADALRGKGHLTEEQSELTRLRREVATLRMEREILKKATVFFMREQS